MLIYLFFEAIVLSVIILVYWYFLKSRQKKLSLKIKIDHYILEKRIGQGGMADIFLARAQGGENPVAVKILHSKCSNDKGIVHRFLMEGKNLTTIKQKYPDSPVVQVYDYGREGTTGRYIIVMEYLPGESLKQILTSKKSINFNLKLHIVREVAKALKASHVLKIYHRDVCPGNIIINGKRVTLIDFGIAKEMLSKHDTDPGILLGKIHYISPEQFNGSRATSKSDIYSLGVVFFYLIEGKPPYDSPNPFEIIRRHELHPIPTIKSQAPHELKQFIYRMLDKNPGVRPDAGEVIEKMDYFLRKGDEKRSTEMTTD